MMPEVLQAMFVAGAIEGITFMSYGSSADNHDEAVACYSKFPLGEFTKLVAANAKANPDFDESVATLVAITAGNVCK